jgi:hypothetical protein
MPRKFMPGKSSPVRSLLRFWCPQQSAFRYQDVLTIEHEFIRLEQQAVIPLRYVYT